MAQRRPPADPNIQLVEPQQRRANLPRPLSSFVGREREITAVLHAFQRSGARLVTLTGPGGIGKTRLALAAADRLVDRYPDGVSFISLAPIADPDLVVPTIAHALNIGERADQPAFDQVAAYLQHRRLLLVLDNFEHLIDAASAISRLLESCPELNILVTSREPLRLTGEREYPVPPLPIPETGIAKESGAVQLFVERARLVDPAFALSESNTPAIVEISRRLDGLPLAIELAAARVKLLSPGELLERLDQPLDLLSGGPRDAPQRQQTMRSTLQWSYDLLQPQEQRLFRRLSVCVGGWTLAAAEVIGEQQDVVDTLSSLVEKGLVRRVERAGQTTRYGMLEPVRQFAAERLARDDGEAAEARQRHAEFFYSSIEGTFKRFDRPDEAAEIERIETEHGNLRAALSWLRENDQIELSLRLIGEIGDFWYQRGYLREGWEQAEATLNAPDAAQPTYGRAQALWSASWLRFSLGDDRHAYQLINESLTIFKQLDDRDGMGQALFLLSALHFGRGEIQQSRADLEQALTLLRDREDPAMVARVAYFRGMFAIDDGDLEATRTILEEGLTIARAHQLHASAALLLGALILVARLSGDGEWEARLLVERLTLLQTIGSLWSMTDTFEISASYIRRQGRLNEACSLLGYSAELFRRAGGTPYYPGTKFDPAEEARALRAALPETEFQTVWERGRVMTVEEATELALRTIDEIQQAPAAAPGGLSRREVEVIGLVVQGLTNVEIGDALYISPRTVAQHLRSIYNKLGVNSRAAAVARWLDLSSS